jgi:hypothetical protein
VWDWHNFSELNLLPLAHPLFTTITHLDIFDRIKIHSQICPDLAGFPALTHLPLSLSGFPGICSEKSSLDARRSRSSQLVALKTHGSDRNFRREPRLLIHGFVVTGWSDYELQWQVGEKGGKVCSFCSVLAGWIFKFH